MLLVFILFVCFKDFLRGLGWRGDPELLELLGETQFCLEVVLPSFFRRFWAQAQIRLFWRQVMAIGWTKSFGHFWQKRAFWVLFPATVVWKTGAHLPLCSSSGLAKQAGHTCLLIHWCGLALVFRMGHCHGLWDLWSSFGSWGHAMYSSELVWCVA